MALHLDLLYKDCNMYVYIFQRPMFIIRQLFVVYWHLKSTKLIIIEYKIITKMDVAKSIMMIYGLWKTEIGLFSDEDAV